MKIKYRVSICNTLLCNFFFNALSLLLVLFCFVVQIFYGDQVVTLTKSPSYLYLLMLIAFLLIPCIIACKYRHLYSLPAFKSNYLSNSNSKQPVLKLHCFVFVLQSWWSSSEINRSSYTLRWTSTLKTWSLTSGMTSDKVSHIFSLYICCMIARQMVTIKW